MKPGHLLFGVVLACASLSPVWADGLAVQIDEVLAGANGDSTIQFIEIKMASGGATAWGPQSGETVGRIRLVFFDATGAQTGEYVFTSDPTVGPPEPMHGGYCVLIATQAFADLPGAPAPDYILPHKVMAWDGKVCITANPANPNAPELNLCLSYGNFVADTGTDHLGQPAGPAAETAPIMDATSLARIQNFNNYGSAQYNADFEPSTPSPRNSAGDEGVIAVLPTVDQGRTLFERETFNGNGRTCMSCHQPDASFSLTPTRIRFIPGHDPLFVAEVNEDLTELENPCLMRGARALILENIDGFANPPNFRGSPHLLNIALTAPYGLSGEIPDLQTFATGAVRQHFPRTLARNSDPNLGPLDFRLPTATELAAMEEFMQSITLPADGNFNLDDMIDAAVARGADAAAIERGRELFNGVTGNAKCFKCHFGPVLARAHPTVGTGNMAFNTGVSALPINATFPDACLGGTPLPPEAGGTREFSTPPLIGVVDTAPYFHNNAVLTLREAVHFYIEPAFLNSPAAQLPTIGAITMTEQDVDDITAFLSALVEPFIDCNNNTIDDRDEIAGGAADCNSNKILDDCELAAADCNGNGVPDACDLGPIAFAAPVMQTGVAGAFFLGAADVDADGDLDLLVPGWTTSAVHILLNSGSGVAYTTAGPFPVTASPRALASADFDGDLDIDVVAPNLFANHVSLLLNNGVNMGTWLGFAPQQTIPMNVPIGQNGGTLHVLAGDVDNDGDQDLLAVKYFMDEIAVVPNLGPDGMGGWLGFGTPVDYPLPVGTGPWSVALGKINGDTYLDLVVVNEALNRVSVLMNSGSGGFLAPAHHAVQEGPQCAAVVDLNSDGSDDIAVSNFDSDTVTVLINDGAGSFLPPSTLVVGSYPFGAAPRSVSAADLDQDGDMDLLAGNFETLSLSVVLNEATGGFSAPLNKALDVQPDYTIIADLNGDGSPDAASVNFVSATVSILLNQTPPLGGDCNSNGIPDSCDISGGASQDLNGNGIPDECELIGDLNNDSVVDFLDLDILAAVLVGADTIPLHVIRADINGDNLRDGMDVIPFVAIILGE